MSRVRPKSKEALGERIADIETISKVQRFSGDVDWNSACKYKLSP
jgi:hypothetical protein